VLDEDKVKENLRDFLDSLLQHDYPLELVFAIGKLGKRCVANDMNACSEMAGLMTLFKTSSSSLH